MTALVSDTAASFHEAALTLLRGSNSIKHLILEAEGTDTFPGSLWKDIGLSGWFKVLLREEFGGLGLGYPELGAIFRAVGQVPIRGPLLDQAVTLPILMNLGDPQLSLLAGPAVNGDEIIAYAEALAPPYGPGRDSLKIEHGRLTGVVDLVPFGHVASSFIVAAHRDARPCLALVGRRGVSTEPTKSLDPCVAYARVTFCDTPIEAGAILASGEKSIELERDIQAAKRLMMASEIAGCAVELTQMSVEYAKVRKQFNRPIGQFQAIKHMLATLAARTSSLQCMVDAALHDAVTEPERIDEIAILAKAYAMLTGRYVAEEALQIHGGIGFTHEFPLHLYYRRVLTHQGFGGETGSLLRQIGTVLLSNGNSR